MLTITETSIEALRAFPNNARIHSKRQVTQIARSIKEFGFNNPILIDEGNMVVAGHGRLMAAQDLGLDKVPTIRLEHLSDVQKRAFILADNKLADKAGWDEKLIKIELQNLLEFDIDIDLTQTGFETPEIDILLNEPLADEQDAADLAPKGEIISRVKSGDIWKLGPHRLLCGDSLKAENFERLMGDEKADLVFTDPPYNVRIDRNVCGKGKTKHAEFSFASGELSNEEFEKFLIKAFESLVQFSKDGSIHYVCMDWRHVAEITVAGQRCYSKLNNICVWNKQVGGMGGLYRSQHELVFVFKNGDAAHTNNIELGKYGRHRTNIWDYPSVNEAGKRSQDLKLHPTTKPVQMISDAIIDCSARGAIILDCFGGSGSTLIAAERTKRKARIIEYEPGYCDVILHRYEQMTGKMAEKIHG